MKAALQDVVWVLTSGRRRSLRRCYECVFDVLQIVFGHLLGRRVALRPWHIARPIHYTRTDEGLSKKGGIPKKEKEKERGGTIVRPPIFVVKRDRPVQTTGAIGAVLDPRRERGRLAAGMRELNTDFGGVRVRKVDRSLERLDLRVGPKTRVLGRDAALGNDRGRFHDDAPRAARREALQYGTTSRGERPSDRGDDGRRDTEP